MMLEHLGLSQQADSIMRAVEAVSFAGVLTPDVGGKASTADVTDAIVTHLRHENVGVTAGAGSSGARRG
jgi:tartrate dehydrogenase/decarboxylase/D-malate dehydrogenase